MNSNEQPVAPNLCCLGLFSVASGATIGYIDGAIGSAILNSAGYDYNASECTAAAVKGTALWCVLYMFVQQCRTGPGENKNGFSAFCLAVGVAALCGAPGAIITEQNIIQCAVVTATGSAVLSAGLYVVKEGCCPAP
jgi:hypothetical protein